MRVLAGSAKGRALRVPRGRTIRPTPAKVREALFSILGTETHTARVLDLYCGVGALGIEALSRGAEHATFVDQSGTALKCVRENLANTGLADRAQTLKRTLPCRFSGSRDGPITLVFSDPPYREDPLAALAEMLTQSEALAEDVLWVHEISANRFRAGGDQVEAPGWEPLDSRRYGDTALLFFERRRGPR